MKKHRHNVVAQFIGLVTLSALLIAATGCAADKSVQLPGLSSCAFMGPGPKPYVATGRDLTFREILLLVNAQAREVFTLKADVYLELSSDILTKVESCNGKLILCRPDKLRLKGFTPFVSTLFDIASNGHQFWVFYPSEKKVYTGDYYREGVWRPSSLDIDPAQLMQGLLVEEIAEDQPSEAVFVEREGDEQYVVYQLDQWHKRSYLRRKIWVDAAAKIVTRQQYFVNDGNLSFDVQYAKFAQDKKLSLPQQIMFFRPDGSSRALVKIVNFEVDQQISPGMFELLDTGNAEVIRLK